MNPRITAFDREPGPECRRQPAAPRISEAPADPRPLTRPFGLISIEEPGLGQERTRAHRRDGHHPLESLGQVMVHGVSQERPNHRVVRAERCETLARAERETDRAWSRPEQVPGRDDELVEVGVRMAPVDEALAPVAEGELTLGHGGAFEI